MTDQELLGFMYECLEKSTLKLRTNDPAKLRQKLYQSRAKFKREHNDGCFDTIQFRIAPSAPNDELWLINLKAGDLTNA